VNIILKKDTTIHIIFRLIAGVKLAVKTETGQTFSFPVGFQGYNNNDDQPDRKKQKRGTYAKRACNNCRNSHTACDSGRPCKRCSQLGLTDCQDAERKKKKRNFDELEKKEFPSMQDFLPLFNTEKNDMKQTIFANLIDENSNSSNEENFL